MAESYRSWTGPARAMARGIDAAVGAAQAADATAFAEALAELVGFDREQLIVVLGAVSRELIEHAFPDGLDSDGAAAVLESCVRSAVAWYPMLDTDALLRALTGALGLAEADGDAAVDPAAVLVHGLLLIADQLTSLRRELGPVLNDALGELRRAQTVELP